MNFYKVFDIDYETDGSDVDLPTEFEFMAESPDDLGDKISDATGWFHNGFSYEQIGGKADVPQIPTAFLTELKALLSKHNASIGADYMGDSSGIDDLHIQFEVKGFPDTRTTSGHIDYKEADSVRHYTVDDC